MKIKTYTLNTISKPLAAPFVTAIRRVDAATAIQLKIYDEYGNEGIGEAPPTEAITGESLESIRDTLTTRLLPAIEGDDLTLDEALSRMDKAVTGRPSAKACLDIALHNLAAKKAGVPLWRFLGAQKPPAIQTAVTISLDSPRAMARQAEGFRRRGLKTLKIKVGKSLYRDIRRIRAIRRAVPDATLLVDANQGWQIGEAFRAVRAIKSLDIALVEQPLPAEDLAGMRELTRWSPIPILADEAAFSLEDVKHIIRSKAADMINVKLMKCGGIAKAREILTWCEANGVQCMMGSMLETPASIEAARALCALYPRTVRYADLDSPLLYADQKTATTPLVTK